MPIVLSYPTENAPTLLSYPTENVPLVWSCPAKNVPTVFVMSYWKCTHCSVMSYWKCAPCLVTSYWKCAHCFCNVLLKMWPLFCHVLQICMFCHVLLKMCTSLCHIYGKCAQCFLMSTEKFPSLTLFSLWILFLLSHYFVSSLKVQTGTLLKHIHTLQLIFTIIIIVTSQSGSTVKSTTLGILCIGGKPLHAVWNEHTPARQHQ